MRGNFSGMKPWLAFLVLLIAGCGQPRAPEIGAQLIRLGSAADDRWALTVRAAQMPPEPFIVQIEFVDRPDFRGKSVDEALAALPADYPYGFVFLADERALTEPGHPCVVVDLSDKDRPRFRAEASTLASIENNLTLANMEFSEFALEAKTTGVFRGFTRER